MKGQVKGGKGSRMTPRFPGFSDGGMAVPSTEMKKEDEEMVWSKGEIFSFRHRESEVIVDHPSRDCLQVA